MTDSGEDGKRGNSHKLVLMGKSKSGKTSMQSIIFANLTPPETGHIGFTLDVNKSDYKFLGMNLSINDCAGQDKLVEHYLKNPIQHFTDIKVFIYVFDVLFIKDEELLMFRRTMEQLEKYSPKASVFVLIHKMDMIDEKARTTKFEEGKQQILKNMTKNMDVTQFFGTSIWDVTLYNAWSKIIQTLLPDLKFLTDCLSDICKISECDEIILFEKYTFLIIAYYEKNPNTKSVVKYERISQIVKLFKMSCNKVGSDISMMNISNNSFEAVIDDFTANTFILLVSKNKNVGTSALKLNIACAKSYFKQHSNKVANILFE